MDLGRNDSSDDETIGALLTRTFKKPSNRLVLKATTKAPRHQEKPFDTLYLRALVPSWLNLSGTFKTASKTCGVSETPQVCHNTYGLVMRGKYNCIGAVNDTVLVTSAETLPALSENLAMPRNVTRLIN